MSGVKGEDNLLSVLIDSSETEIEFQGDAVFNSGKSQETKRSKNGSLGYQVEAGATITASFDKVRPLSAGQAEIYRLSDTGETAQFTLEDPNSGGHKRVGSGKVTISEEPSNVEGLVTIPFTIAFEGDPVTTVNP